jgi:hypothetical protein
MSPRKLSPLLRWPIRRADVAAALGENFDRIDLVWCDWDKSGSQAPLSAEWAPSPDGIGAGEFPARVKIWVHPVPQAEAETIRLALISPAMSDLAAWSGRALDATETWKSARHERVWRYRSGALGISDDDGLHILDRERGSH